MARCVALLQVFVLGTHGQTYTNASVGEECFNGCWGIYSTKCNCYPRTCVCGGSIGPWCPYTCTTIPANAHIEWDRDVTYEGKVVCNAGFVPTKGSCQPESLVGVVSGKYVVGPMGGQCPSGAVDITSKIDCQEAVNMLWSGYGTIDDFHSPDYPIGCLRYWLLEYGVFWNHPSQGTHADSIMAKVCKQSSFNRSDNLFDVVSDKYALEGLVAPNIENTMPLSDADVDAQQDACLVQVNKYRATKGIPALTLNSGKQSCATADANQDGPNFPSSAHGSFGKCGEGGQCEAAGTSTCAGAIDMYFNEGPGTDSSHGHYNIIMSANYKSMSYGYCACSKYSHMWTHNFYRSSSDSEQVVV